MMVGVDVLIEIHSRQQSLKQESFYIDGQHNTKLSVLKTDSQNASTKKKSVRKYSPGSVSLIPINDENEPSRVRRERERFILKHALSDRRIAGLVKKAFAGSIEA